MARAYTATDTERFVPESHSSKRSDFARDRGRLLHSSALRRLAAKTQVLSPTAGLDFARNRLTHSLEVAQIGRELANRVGVDADVVETACLAHDIGHPPFGHNGEKALSDWAADSGGFEGNAQTFRLLVRLEPKVVDSRGVPRGLNLTRASLLASMKYPWGAEASETDASGREKFGVYDDDREVFDWVRNGMQGRQLSLEAQIMDFSDDVAYSVHDFEDAVVNGYVDPRMLVAHSHRDEVVHSMLTHAAGGNVEALRVAWDRLSSVPGWVTDFDARRSGLASLKNLTSTLIGRFAESSSVIGGETLHVPEGTAAEIAVLKGIVSHHVMSHTARQPIYLEQRGQLSALATRFYNNPNELDPVFALDWAQAGDTDAKARVVVDQVASLTDQSALALHQRLCS